MFSKFCFKKKCDKTRSSVMNQSHFFKVALSPVFMEIQNILRSFFMEIWHGLLLMIWMVFYGSQKGRRKELQKDLSNCSKIAIKRQNDKKSHWSNNRKIQTLDHCAKRLMRLDHCVFYFSLNNFARNGWSVLWQRNDGPNHLL